LLAKTDFKLLTSTPLADVLCSVDAYRHVNFGLCAKVSEFSGHWQKLTSNGQTQIRDRVLRMLAEVFLSIDRTSI
jgi:hypothetical protein